MEGYGPLRNRGTNELLALPLDVESEYTVSGKAENASPIAISGGLLFAESDRKLHVLSLENGQEQWQINLAGSFLSPAVANGTVYVREESGEEGYVVALQADSGKKRWQYKFDKVGSSYDNVGGHVTSPIAVDGLVLVGAGEALYALDAQTGGEVWRFTTEYPVVSSVSIAEGIAYFADFTRLYALDIETGQEQWRFDHGQLSLYFAPILIEDQVAIAGYDTIYMLDRAQGALVWMKNFAEMQVIPAGASQAHLYVKSSNQLWALNRGDGQVVWNFATTSFISLPAITTDQLYVITRSEGGSQLRALQQTNGEEVWRIDRQALTNAAPVVAGGRVYVRTTNGSVLVFEPS
jgi:outer membrane protein assembly factor BamB